MTYPSDSYMANLNFLVKLGFGSWFPIWAVRSGHGMEHPFTLSYELA